MKKLLIIVPKGSSLNSYLMKNYCVYSKISDLDDKVCYKYLGLPNSMEAITYLITMFMLQDFSIHCSSGDSTFFVFS